MEYNKFLESKRKTFLESGFEIDESELNSNLFDFQKFTVKTALSKGRFAIFADCGLGPFGGIGSEGCSAIRMNRKSISIELKESYFKLNANNHKSFVEEKNSVLTLF